ncbi:hypothetical protein [Baekduia sp.]|uniref:response regulator transcription factor n=1 Tax=Baekduia sp. TaxID=2600305 RepID=UPI002D1F9F09|nr:hypothetical protein [Baekduia sp.]
MRHLRLVVPRSIRVVVADEFELHRAGLRALLEDADDITVVGEATGGDEAGMLVRALRPDVVVLDLGGTELEALDRAGALVTDAQRAGVGLLILATAAAADRPRCRGDYALLVEDSGPTELVEAVRGLATRPRFPTHRTEEASPWNSGI